MKALRSSSALLLMHLLCSFLRCIIAIHKAIVIKGPSFARKYFFLRGACLSSVFVTTASKAPYVIMQFRRNLIAKILPAVLCTEMIRPFFLYPPLRTVTIMAWKSDSPACIDRYGVLETSFSVCQNQINTSRTVRLKPGCALGQI